MSVRSMKADDPLEDFAGHEITLDGVTKRVCVAGSRPAVIVMTEMPGISPQVAHFARSAGAGSLPARTTARRPAGLEIAPEDFKVVRDRLEREDLTVMAYRFEGDRFCRGERFAAYAAALGNHFVGRVLPDSAANTDVAPFFARRVACPHSVVTAHLIDEAGQPTIAARDEILSFFARRLHSPMTA